MKGLLREIQEIPEKAILINKTTKNTNLPLNIPIIGMGSSYYCSFAIKYNGINIHPEIASEFFNYSSFKTKEAILISQSGESSEVVWCSKLFKQYIAITNNHKSSLTKKLQKLLIYRPDKKIIHQQKHTSIL